MAERHWVDVRRDDRGVAVVTIDNSAKLNTLNTRVMTGLVAAVEQLGADDSLRAVVLRGAG
jgi:enoyl-CoA hydratase